MYALHPTVSQCLFYRSTSEFDPALVAVSPKFVDARHPDHYGGCVCHKAETFFALSQCPLYALALCDIKQDGHPSVYHSVCIERWCVSRRDPSGPNTPILHLLFVVNLFARERPFEMMPQ